MCDIRPLRKADYDQFMPIINAFTRFPEPVSREQFEAWFDKMGPNVHTFVYDVDGTLHGTAKVVLEPKFSNNLAMCGHVEDVAVLPTSRNQGIARAMVDYIVKFCWDSECYKIVLDCAEGLVPLYAKSGFKPKGQEMAQYRNP
jgi:glucosamine-phosphate N-acetyltransferase